MFCPNKNSFLQMTVAMNPRVINKAVRRAMRKKHFDPHDELPPTQRLESMQPSMFAPWVDITRAHLGFGRRGLRLINRELNSEDSLVQLQAIHSILDQVQIAENAMFLIDLNVVYRLIDLMQDRDPIVREKVAYILTHLANYHQGRQRIMSRPIVIDHLIYLFMRDRKEIRYVAALLLKTLTRDRCSCEIIMKNNNIIGSLLKMIKDDYMTIVIFHLNSLKYLTEWDPVPSLKANAFQVMKKLIKQQEFKIVAAAMDCMVQLLKHDVGKKLADQHDLTHFLRKYLLSPDIEVVMATAGLMCYTTLTTRAKWRVKEYQYDFTRRLVSLCVSHNFPVLQLRCMQVLINLCDSPDIRAHLKKHWEKRIMTINIREHEQWDGTSETTSYGLETGHNYRTMCIEGVETIRNDYGDSIHAVNVTSYLRRLQEVKAHLIEAINFQPHIN
ncbi:unnamed protein product [Chrysodeixis includens]|uniref:Uncharacterized protein n=1 Tax=Chrysodeixis includens TaxID=689277 RepID=A0A9P0BYE2_CHRIL|nr:unnamed protein product [Chrysodeixis includens]